MELKGVGVKNLPPHKKMLMERTLGRMKETRRKDQMLLRDLVNEKLDWALKEKQKGLDTIESMENQIESLENQKEKVGDQVLKLEGIILVLNELKEAGKEEIEKEKNKKKSKKSTKSKKKKKKSK